MSEWLLGPDLRNTAEWIIGPRFSLDHVWVEEHETALLEVRSGELKPITIPEQISGPIYRLHLQDEGVWQAGCWHCKETSNKYKLPNAPRLWEWSYMHRCKDQTSDPPDPRA